MRIAIMLLALLLPAAAARGGPIDLEQARALFASAKTLSDADDGALWGRPLYGPILFVDRATRAIVANHADDEGRLRRHDDELFTGRLPDTVSLGNTATPWAGMWWTMLLWPLPPAEASAGTLLMHECFHRIQPKLGIPLAMPDNHHLDTAVGRQWLRLELRALAQALDDEDPAASVAVADALVFRAYRRSLFPPAEEEERALELNEGLAEYTGLRLGGLDDAGQRHRAHAALARYDRPTGTFVRSFAYATGPAWGLLLDRARPRWQRRVSRRADCAAMLARAIRFRPPKALEDEAHARAAGWGLADVRAEERARETERQGALARLRARFVEGPVLSLSFEGDVNFSFSPHDVHALDGIGTVYGTFRMSAAWGILDARGGALVVEEDRRRRVCVPAPADPPPADARTVHGDGWTLELAPGWRTRSGGRPGDLVVHRGLTPTPT